MPLGSSRRQVILRGVGALSFWLGAVYLNWELIGISKQLLNTA
jgi:hypothetical protein